ncbi:MAG TPA: CPXCG motif-containing cysteine-rich protein [Thermoanaerobaculia bacterium]|nr:CPXCG motif-containing cysteine-rich protein [Thermoanaerobaculia bacterium]
MSGVIRVSCPYCGKEADLVVDEGGGSRQTYVQDCPVCCQPWEVEATRDRESHWSAVVRTLDE